MLKLICKPGIDMLQGNVRRYELVSEGLFIRFVAGNNLKGDIEVSIPLQENDPIRSQIQSVGLANINDCEINLNARTIKIDTRKKTAKSHTAQNTTPNVIPNKTEEAGAN